MTKPLPFHKSSTAGGISDVWNQFHADLSAEMGESLAFKLVEPLYSQSGGNVQAAADLYGDVGRAWAPLMLHWRNWISENAEHDPKLLMRDCKPLAMLPNTSHWAHLHLNRKVLGIADELSGDEASSQSSQASLLSRYLDQQGLTSKPNTLVDTGCWGTMVQKLHHEFGLHFQPLFFFSHNPYIRGMLNDHGVSETDGEVLNDSLECSFPKITRRVSAFAEAAGQVVPVEQQSPSPSLAFGQAALKQLKAAAHLLDGKKLPSVTECVEQLLEKAHKARAGHFTGILPEHSPSWSEGQKFLASWKPCPYDHHRSQTSKPSAGTPAHA